MRNSSRFLFVVFVLFAAELSAREIVNDVTQLNPIIVDRVVKPKSVEEIQQLVRDHRGPISVGGGHFSMGGQTASENTLHLDMRSFNEVRDFNPEEKTIVVDAGITWRKIQETIDPKNLSVKVMQSYANFTVGGSLSVNVHGRYVGLGSVISTVRSFRIVLPNGDLISASPTENSEIFYGAIGGYGGLGVIVEVSLDLADNVAVVRSSKTMAVRDYKKYFDEQIRDNSQAVFHNGDIYPPDYEEVRAITWSRTDKRVTVPERLMPIEDPSFIQRAALYGLTELPGGKAVRAKIVDPLTYKGEPVVWRNFEASYDVRSLEPSSRESSTFVLQEYFIPVGRFEEFIPKMRSIFKKYDANILNVSIRHAHKDPGSLLAWAREECFAFVIYYKQKTSLEAQKEVHDWTRKLIDAAVESGGSYYLPYQIVASSETFHRAYPRAQEYFELKKKLDPAYRFRNKLWDKYYRPVNVALGNRPEDNTFLTLPEWYVVYSAVDFAEHLKVSAPSEFPYFSSIGQFWSMYGDVISATSKYPFNSGYHLMISVVGVSFTIENFLKGIYENTLGAWTEPEDIPEGEFATEEDKFLAGYASDYASFIHHTPWYSYPFKEKLKQLWQIKSENSEHFIRRWERKLFGSLELGARSAYAYVIGWGTAAAYAPEDLEILVVAETDSVPKELDPRVKKISEEDEFLDYFVVPRYQLFTEIMLKLSKSKLRTKLIAGNDEIVMTAIAPEQWSVSSAFAASMVSEQTLLTKNGFKRIALKLDVEQLSSAVSELEKQGVRVEHLYDY